MEIRNQKDCRILTVFFLCHSADATSFACLFFYNRGRREQCGTLHRCGVFRQWHLFLPDTMDCRKAFVQKMPLVAAHFRRICSITVFLPFVGIWYKNGICAICCQITYFPKSFSGFFQLLAALGIASFLLGGFLEMLFAFTDAQRFLGKGLTISVSMMPWQRLLWGCLLFYILLKAGERWLECHGKNRGQYCRITVESGGKTVNCTGFLDTGNELRTEAGKPVVVLELARCVPLLPKESALCLLLGKSLPEKEAAFFSQIPFAAVGISSGMLTWFTAEHLTVTQGKISRKYDQMPIGIYMDRFTGGSAALVPPVLLEEEGI